MLKGISKLCLSWVIVVLLVGALLDSVGCTEKDKKYDVAIKVANNYGQEWVFTPDVDELHYEFEYTGEEMTVGVDEYYVYGDPQVGDRWLDCAGVAINYFHSRLGYRSLEGTTPQVDSVVEKGDYCYTVHADGNSSWNYRTVRLFITVK